MLRSLVEQSDAGGRSMSLKRIQEKDLLKNLTAHTAHAEELATPMANEVDPLERLKDSVLRYERPLDPVWDEYLDSEGCSEDFMPKRDQPSDPNS